MIYYVLHISSDNNNMVTRRAISTSNHAMSALNISLTKLNAYVSPLYSVISAHGSSLIIDLADPVNLARDCLSMDKMTISLGFSRTVLYFRNVSWI